MKIREEGLLFDPLHGCCVSFLILGEDLKKRLGCRDSSIT
jgi:hypothetical protein